MTNTGEPARDVKEGGEEEGRDSSRNSKARQAVGWGIVVGAWESHVHQDED